MISNDMNRYNKRERSDHDEAEILLTSVVSIMQNATNLQLVEVIRKYFSSDEIKDAKSILCDASHIEFRNRTDSQNRLAKMAHVNDIVDVLQKLDQCNAIPFFVPLDMRDGQN